MTNYPGLPIIDTSRKYHAGVVTALRRFRAAGPWKGTQAERLAKFCKFHRELQILYGRSTTFDFAPARNSNGTYNRTLDSITLIGKLSVVTLLHEWAHALHGSSERTAVSWSVTLFARVWPEKAAAMVAMATDHRLTTSRSGR